MYTRTCPLLFVASLFFLMSCGGGGSSSTAPPNPPPPPPPPYEPEPNSMQPTLSSIQEHVFTPICTACHIGSAAPQGLRLEAGMSHGMLVGVPSVGVPSVDRVEPGDPDNSFLIHKLEGTQASGDRMPLGGPYLSQEVIDIIRQWITDGATDTAAPQTAPPAKVAGTWPMPGAQLVDAPAAILLVFDRALDVSTIHADSVRVLKLDEIDPATLEPRQIDGVAFQITNPTTLRLTLPSADWAPGGYEVQVLGVGAARVTDIGGWPIDGLGDGQPGGDFVLQFSVHGSAR